MQDGGPGCTGPESVKSISSTVQGRLTNVDALSRNPCMLAPQEGIGESEVQVAAVSSEPDISFSTSLQAGPMGDTSASFSKKQE